MNNLRNIYQFAESIQLSEANKRDLINFIIFIQVLIIVMYLLILLISLLLWRKSVNKHGKTTVSWRIWLIILCVPPVILFLSVLLP